MVDWKIEYYDDGEKNGSVEEMLDSLTDIQFKSVAKEMKLLAVCGNTLRLPHSKSLGKGLFELRERRFGNRVYYTFLYNRIIVMLYAGTKSNQPNDIKIARKHLFKLLNNGR